ncbi:LacI family DNA-binding transcriptional regulator [Tessaracoccus lapidicaptus]|uniref:LacI family DNA-binding transcriptional regulator n=1 Tax=Tessaracoccus lapidicaptus TaxID=1427523 RepID=UPI00333FE726
MNDQPRSRRYGTATLIDVANEAGVSLATASRVLNGSTRKVADSYRDKVRAAADRLGYTVNVSAQAVASGGSALIALLVADIADPYFAQVAAGVARGADEAGHLVTIATTGRDPQREAALLRVLRGQRPRGVILAASRMAAPHEAVQMEIDAIHGNGGRVIALGPGAAELRSVVIDNWGGARQLGLALAERGYRRAVVLAAPRGLITTDQRLAGFTDGFTAGGGVVAAVHRAPFTREGGAESMRAALAEGIAPGTLVFALSDAVAMGALRELRDAGRIVGGDVALAGFDDIPAAEDVTPALTSVHIPLEEVGYQAVRAAIDSEWTPAPLRMEVHLRASTPPVS